MRTTGVGKKLTHIPVDDATPEAALAIPDQATGLVLFAHGSGSSGFRPRNDFVAGERRRAGLGTLLIDLLTHREDQDRAGTSFVPTIQIDPRGTWCPAYRLRRSTPLTSSGHYPPTVGVEAEDGGRCPLYVERGDDAARNSRTTSSSSTGGKSR